MRLKLNMNRELKAAFTQVKPICDSVMVSPSMESLESYSTQVGGLKIEIVQQMQQYLLYPLLTRIKCDEVRQNLDLHLKILEVTHAVLDRITMNSWEMLTNLEMGLLSIIFDSKMKGMIADNPEELKLYTVKCMTALMVNTPIHLQVKLLKKQVPMLAQAVFVSVNIAKMERLRALRVAAIQSVMAHTMTHPQMTDDYRMPDDDLELLAVDNFLSTILPGVLGALQEVCSCTDNPTHVVIAEAIEAIHRILCITMHDKYYDKKPVTTADFVNMIAEKKTVELPQICDTDVSNADQKKPVVEKSPKDMARRSEEWFEMAGDKLTLVTKKLTALSVHEHFKVRKELAVFSYRVLTECSTTMPHSAKFCMDMLITMSKDSYPEVANYCGSAINSYLTVTPEHALTKTLDCTSDAFVFLCTNLPRLLNSIDCNRKLSNLRLLHGYIQVLEPRRLTAALSVAASTQLLCTALAAAALHCTSSVPLTRITERNVLSAPPLSPSWSYFQNLDSLECVIQLQEICSLLGGAECAELVLDVLLDRFQQKRDCETVYILNWMITSPNSTASMAKRMLYAYIENDTWYLPLDIKIQEEPPTEEETYDIGVYNPRAWIKEITPGLYEGTKEIRYTDLSLQKPRESKPKDPRCCDSLGEAQSNLTLSCLLTEGVGMIARRVQAGFQPFLLKTLCIILERVGSEYEMIHLAGLKAINEIAAACGYGSVGQLIYHNADYFINQITIRLKKEWSCQSALQILSVVLEYSDASILDFFFDIVQDVLYQNCDMYYERDLVSYLMAYLTFVERIRVWFPVNNMNGPAVEWKIDLLDEVRDYVRDTQEAERMLSDTDFEKSCGKTAEEMYKEDLKRKEEEELDYDDRADERQQLPQHIVVTVTILRRSIHFVTSGDRNVALLSLQILQRGLPILAQYEDELLPIVHEAWEPLTAKFQSTDLAVWRRAVDVLGTMATLAKDFIRSRTVKEVLPEIYKFLRKSLKDSYLKDAGAAYRSSAAFNLQLWVLDVLPGLVVDLRLADDSLAEAMGCVQLYLSNKQPVPLQESAVRFFKLVSEYEYPAAWYHFRQFCNNEILLQPPKLKYMTLEPIVGTPNQPDNKEYESNINMICNYMTS